MLAESGSVEVVGVFDLSKSIVSQYFTLFGAIVAGSYASIIALVAFALSKVSTLAARIYAPPAAPQLELISLYVNCPFAHSAFVSFPTFTANDAFDGSAGIFLR